MIKILSYSKESDRAEIKKLLARRELDLSPAQYAVDEILKAVKEKGDQGLFYYTKKFDGADLDGNTVKITEAEIEEAYSQVDLKLLEIIRRAAQRITDFHQKQRQNSWFCPTNPGEILGQMVTPIERVGVYVPGGTAFYPSSVLMNVLPAKVAGVSEIVMVTPCNSDGKVFPLTLVAAKEAGVTEAYRVGGAQAIAAMAYGTESIKKVNKIVGPGNIYVALAKKSVFGTVGIDSVAGPSEILIVADHTANPSFVAADLLSQAEHDTLASSVLITTSMDLAEEVKKHVSSQTSVLSRKDIITSSLKDFGAIIVVDSLENACSLSNEFAPEHLELCVKEPFLTLTQIKNAGAVFLGHFAPEPVGDYFAGPNHVLPTNGSAKHFSALSVDDFVKKTSILSFERSKLMTMADDIIDFANAEGLDAHANAVRIRRDSTHGEDFGCKTQH